MGMKKMLNKGRLAKLVKELEQKHLCDNEEDNKSWTKTIKTWMFASYEIGLKDAGDIIGKSISKKIKEHFDKDKLNSEGGRNSSQA